MIEINGNRFAKSDSEFTELVKELVNRLITN